MAILPKLECRLLAAFLSPEDCNDMRLVLDHRRVAHLTVAVELSERDHRHVELSRKRSETSSYRGHLRLAALVLLRAHDLQVVYDDQADVLPAPKRARRRSNLSHRWRGA